MSTTRSHPSARRLGTLGWTLCATGLWLCLPSSAWADLVIVNGTVHTIAQPPAAATVVIRDGVIAEVGPGITPGPEDTVIDAAGMIVTPGFVDFGSSLGLVEVWAVGDTDDTDAGGDEIRAGFQAADAVNPWSTLIPVARCEGVTSVVTHPSGGLVSGQSAWFDLAVGDVDDLALLTPITMDFEGGAAGANATGGSRGSAMLRYRELFADVRAFLADPAAYQAGQMRDLTASLVDLEALAPVVAGELPVLFHANAQADILAGLRLADEIGFPILIAGGAEAWALADELAARQVFVLVVLHRDRLAPGRCRPARPGRRACGHHHLGEPPRGDPPAGGRKCSARRYGSRIRSGFGHPEARPGGRTGRALRHARARQGGQCGDLVR
jgi:hypothetical protein